MTGGPRSRPLEGLALGLSVSESEDTAGLGVSSREVNRSALRVATSILGQGGRMVFGHDWREDGVMDTILQLAVNYHGAALDAAADRAAMTNLVPWPLQSSVTLEERQHYQGILKIIEMPAPAGYSGPRPRSPKDDPAAFAAALTEMRRELNRNCDARLCIGGRTRGFMGAVAGVFEEAVLSIEDEVPLYLSGIFGGASLQAIRALYGEDVSDSGIVTPQDDVAIALEQAGLSRAWDRYMTVPGEVGIERLAERNRLSVEENNQLFAARSLSEVVGLVLKGMARLKRDPSVAG